VSRSVRGGAERDLVNERDGDKSWTDSQASNLLSEIRQLETDARCTAKGSPRL
jgi:hypothetical protein